MRPDPLVSLVRLRKRSLDDAQRTLVRSLQAEAAAQRAASDGEREIAREMEAAADPGGPDVAVEAFAAWLPGARQRLERLRCHLEAMAAETAVARAGVTACRTALDSVETLLQERRDAARLARERKWQAELDDRPDRREHD